MQFSLPRDVLLTCLHRVVGVLDRKQALPILSHVLIKIQDDTLAITCTDSEVELVAFATLDAAQAATTITLPGRKLYDICRVLPEGSRVDFKLSQQLMQIHCGRSRFSLQTLPASDYPSLEDLPADVEITLLQKDFCSLLALTQFAIAQQDVRYFLNGLLLHLQGTTLTAVASDGHRLAMAELSLATAVTPAMRILVPRRGILELIKLLDASDADASMTLFLSQAHMQIKTDAFLFTSRLIDAQFPDYKRFFPRSFDKHVTLPHDALKQALLRAAILANDKVKSIRFDLADNLLTLTSTNQEHEVAEEPLVVSYDGGPVSIGFNLSYLIDVLQVLADDTLTLQIASDDSSVLIESAKDRIHASYLIMVLQI